MQATTLLCAVLLFLVVGGWFFDWWKRRRRGMWVRAVGFPLHWAPLVERGLPVYRALPHDLRVALQEKAFFKINDLFVTSPGGVDQVTEAMRVSLGVHIGLLQAQLRIAPVPALRQVVVGTSADIDEALRAFDPPWNEGTLLAEWDPDVGAARCYREERDPGLMDHWRRLGKPGPDGDLLSDDRLYFAGWASSLWTDLVECRRAALARAPELAEEPGLFAAATEAFVRRPSSLRAAAPSLFEALKHFYLYDPSRWDRGGQQAPTRPSSVSTVRPAAAAGA